MTWIGGIFSKCNTSHSDLRKKLAVMMDTACPQDEPPLVGHRRRIESVFDDADRQILAAVFRPGQETPPEHVHTDHQAGPVVIYDGHLYDSESQAVKLSPAKDRVRKTTAGSLVDLLAELPGDLEQKVRRALARMDGSYALAASDMDQIVISRDSLGTKPLYFAENHDFSAFASNKKPLWNIGMDEVRPLRAGMFAVFDQEKVVIKKALPFRKKEAKIRNMSQAVDNYERALRSAMCKRLATMNQVRKVGVLLSGGVDSCLIAKLLHDAVSSFGMEVTAYTAGSSGSPDVRFARAFARELGIKHKTKTLNVDRVEEYIPNVIEAIEDSDFVQVETGIGLYAAIDLASQDGIEIVFSGQGPDELWGGYSWYPNVLAKDGRQALYRRMWDDFSRADVETLDRENKIAMGHGIELLFPYLDTEVVDVAMSVASELKVASEEDRLGKHPHRQLAMKMGLAERYANREKLAIQHGTAVHGLLDDIATRNGFDQHLVKDIGYGNGKITTAKLGSSARYGHRYTEKGLWQVPQHVQFFFHVLAYRKGLLNKSVRDRIRYFMRKAGPALNSS